MNENIQQIAGLVLAIIGAVGLVPLVNWIKAKVNIDGGKAQIVAAAVAVIVAVASLLASGELNIETVTSDSFVAILLLVWTASQEIYKRITAVQTDT